MREVGGWVGGWVWWAGGVGGWLIGWPPRIGTMGLLLPAGGTVHAFVHQWPKGLKVVCRMNFLLPMVLPACLAAGVDIVLPAEATPQMFVLMFLVQHLQIPSAMLAFFRG